VYVSTQLRTPAAVKFFCKVQKAEEILNCIGILACPDLFSTGMASIDKLKRGEDLHKWHDNVKIWPSFFSGMEVIANRHTPSHRDGQGGPACYDFLISAGRHSNGWLDLPDIDARLSYDPCTVVALCGKILRHGVDPKWTGERLCIAHFIRDNVHDRQELERPPWVSHDRYLSFMDNGFCCRQGVAVDN
jgi:hypothetical protein